MNARRATLAAITICSIAGAAGAFGEPPAREGHDRAELRERITARFDADSDGVLSAEERRTARDAIRDRTHDRIIARFDADGDGELSEPERQAAREARRQRVEEQRDRALTALQRRGLADLPPHIAEAIAEFDMDADGLIADDERVMLEIEIDARIEARRTEITTRFDADGDGQLDESERRVARETVRTERDAEHDARRAELLEKFDANADGVLDREERQAIRAEQGPPQRDALLELIRPRPGREMMQRRGRGPAGLDTDRPARRARPGDI